MAVARGDSGTLSGANVATIEISGGYSSVEVVNRADAGGGDITVAVANGAAPTAPTALADDLDVVMPGERLTIDVNPGDGNTFVSLIGNGQAYTVTGVPG